jgi:molybdopterin converting factor small subunit
MKVTVKMGAPLSQVVGETKVILSLPEGSTIGAVLDALRVRYPSFEAGLQGKGLHGDLKQIPYMLFVNARPVNFEDTGDTMVHDGDRVFLFVAVAGG